MSFRKCASVPTTSPSHVQTTGWMFSWTLGPSSVQIMIVVLVGQQFHRPQTIMLFSHQRVFRRSVALPFTITIARHKHYLPQDIVVPNSKIWKQQVCTRASLLLRSVNESSEMEVCIWKTNAFFWIVIDVRIMPVRCHPMLVWRNKKLLWGSSDWSHSKQKLIQIKSYARNCLDVLVKWTN